MMQINGNNASCTSNITVLDTNTPVIICPSDTTFGANQTGCIGTYAWNTPDLPCAAVGVFAPIPSGSNFNIGTTTVQLFALDAGFSQIASCSFNVTVEDNFSVSIDSSSNPLCAGSNDGEIYISTTEGQAPFTYDWNNDGTGDSDDLEDITNAIDGLNSVDITDNVGCTATASTTLTEPSALTLSLTKTDETRTIQGSIDLSISGGTLPYTYDWNNDGTNDFDDSEDLTNIVPGDYNVTVRDDNGCSITQLIPILDLEPAFITTWKTDNAGVSSTTSITIPTNPSTSLVYDYDIDWNGDGIYDEFNVTGDITHNYGTAGTYEVRIRGNFPSLFFDNGGDADKLLDVNQFGSIQWEIFYSAFRGCSNITTFSATDTPDITLVTSMRTAFANCENFDSNMENWDVSNVSNFYGTFQGASSFNQPLDN